MITRAELLNDAEEAMKLVLDGRQSTIWTAIPGIIHSVDFASSTCEVQPTIQGVVTDENGTESFVDLPLLVDVPIVFPGAGGFFLTLPLAVNDEVLVVFSSRCIDSWWQSGGVQKPMEARMHDLSDGFAFPAALSQAKKLGGISSTGAQLRNRAGTTYIEIAANGKIKLVSPTSVEVSGDLNVTGDVVAGTISLKNHEHPVTTAPGTTGAPIP